MVQRYETLTLDVRDKVATLCLNRPDQANALTPQMSHDLFQAALVCQADPAIRAVILTARGTLFCGGGDLKAFQSCGAELPKVAGGAGLSLVCAGDLALACESAKFTLAYTAAGLTPDGSSTYFLAKHIGLRRAKEMALTNRVLSAAEALDWGLINQVTSAADLLPEAQRLAARLAAGPTQAFGVAKRLLLDGASAALESQMEAEARGISAIATTQDARQGIQAFLNKEKPTFTGT